MTQEPPKKPSEREALIHLLSRVAHDLRGPAGITSGVLDELESREDDKSANAQLFAMARRGLTGVLRIAERLEMVAQLENGPPHFELVPIELGELVKAAVEGASVVQKRKAVKTSVDVPPDLRVAGDARWLRATLLEIVANGIRHAKASVRVSAASSDGRTHIVIEDDGSGFSDEALAAASDPRFSRTGQRLGLGLSLSIARDVVAAHQGTIAFARGNATSSMPGARVVLDLPSA